jgi:hypothetical protein
MNHRISLWPSDPLHPRAVRLCLALSFGALPLLAWWLDWHDLVGPAVILALVVCGAIVGHGIERQQEKEASRQECVRQLQDRE